MKPKFKIIADTLMNNCRLIDLETGKIVPGVQKISWSVDTDFVLTRCTIELVNVDFEGEVEADVKHVPVAQFKSHSEDFAKLLEAIESDTLPAGPAPKKVAKKIAKKTPAKKTVKKTVKKAR